MTSSIDAGIAAMNALNSRIDEIEDSSPGAGDTQYIQKAFIAMVGPPARGKSSSFEVLCEYFIDTRNLSVCMVNAGSLRRKWELDVKTEDNETFGSLMRNVVGNNPDANEIVDRLIEWKERPETTAIPGDLFRHLKVLNNVFAKVCWEIGMAMISDGQVDVCVFDATNTDCERRQNLLESFRAAGSGLDDADFLFIENLCSNKKQLFRNFASKLKASNDYNKYFEEYTTDQIMELVDEYTAYDDCIERILEDPIQGNGDDDLRPLFVEHMTDIIMRDITSYQAKYIPLHVACADTGLSTIDMMGPREYYAQVINKACAKSDGPKTTIINSNMHDGPLLERFRDYTVGPSGANYESELRYTFTSSDYEKVMAALRPQSGGRKQQSYLLPLALLFATVVSSMCPRLNSF